MMDSHVRMGSKENKRAVEAVPLVVDRRPSVGLAVEVLGMDRTRYQVEHTDKGMTSCLLQTTGAVGCRGGRFGE